MQEKLKKPKNLIAPIEPQKPVFPEKNFNKKADKVINITDDVLGDSFKISFKELIFDNINLKYITLCYFNIKNKHSWKNFI